jgi:hypothetical protein
MEGTGFMRIEHIRRMTLGLFALLGCEAGSTQVWAQPEPQPPKPSAAIPLEITADQPGGNQTTVPLAPVPGSTMVSPPAMPGQAVPSYGGPGGNAKLRQLRNPFDNGTTPYSSTGGPMAASQGTAQQVYPTRQMAGPQNTGGKASLQHLLNPYDAEYGQQNHGLFGHPSPQYPVPGTKAIPGAPAAPGAVPGAAPGAEAGPGAPAAPGAPALPGAEAAGAAAAETFGAAAAAAGPGFGTALGAAAAPFNMIGDMSPFRSQSVSLLGSGAIPHAYGRPSPPPVPGLRGPAPLFPSVRNFKMSENMSPRPQDRIFYDFNYFNNLNAAVNRADRVQISNMKAYINLWGVEKTFCDGNGSIGLRLPLNTLTADSPGNNISTPTTSALGNLTIFAKYILAQNVRTGSLVSAGLAVTPSTGTTRFAGAPYLIGINTTYFQPFLAYIWKADRFYVQGFSGFDFPANNADVTYMYNDIATGYFLYRNDDPNGFLTAIVPAFEAHVNSPFNHRNVWNPFDIAASPNVVSLTYGLHVQFWGRAVLSCALVQPVSNPRPFDTEVAMLLNIYYGRTARSQIPITPPVVQ